MLKFVFENISLTEGEISYKLNFPFNEFVNINNPKGNKVLPHEPIQTLTEQILQANDNENVQMRALEPHELAVSLKNQGLAKNFANPIQAGWQKEEYVERKSAQLYCVLVNHRSEILEMKEQVQLIRSLLAA